MPEDQLIATCYGLYVIINDEHDEPGELWLTVYNKEYFNLFGVLPQEKRFLEKDIYKSVPLVLSFGITLDFRDTIQFKTDASLLKSIYRYRVQFVLLLDTKL